MTDKAARQETASRASRSLRKMVSFRLTVEELTRLSLEATRRRISLSTLLRIALEQMLDGNQAP